MNRLDPVQAKGDFADQATILYLGTVSGDPIHERTLAGIRRYAALRGWDVRCEAKRPSLAAELPSVLASHRPVAGCVVEASDEPAALSQRLFGRVPAVFLHAREKLRRSGAVCVNADNEAIARAAFAELSLGRPAAYAVVGVREGFSWSRARAREFRRLASNADAPCHLFPTRRESRSERLERLAAWVRTLPPKTAVFAVNDFTAAYVAAAARMSRRHIPRDLSLIGVDDNAEVCETSKPTISSIRLDHERAGFLAARSLGNIISHRGTESRRNHVLHNSQMLSVPGDLLCGSVTLCDKKHFPVGPLMAVWRESTRGRGRREPFVLKAVETIRREACDGLTAEALARRFPVSQTLFNLRFREATGHSVLDEILHVRLEKAFELLSTTDTPVGIVADFCGFGCYRALDRIFRTRLGMSMSEWRKRNANLKNFSQK